MADELRIDADPGSADRDDAGNTLEGALERLDSVGDLAAIDVDLKDPVAAEARIDALRVDGLGVDDGGAAVDVDRNASGAARGEDPLDHGVFQALFGAMMTLLIAMEFKHSIIRVALRRGEDVVYGPMSLQAE